MVSVIVIFNMNVAIRLGSQLTGDIWLVDSGDEDGQAYDSDNNGAKRSQSVMTPSNPSVRF